MDDKYLVDEWPDVSNPRAADDYKFDLENPEDVAYIKEHIEWHDGDLDYENLEFDLHLDETLPGYSPDYGPYPSEDEVVHWSDSWIYRITVTEADLLDYIKAAYPDGFTGKDLKEFSLEGWNQFLLKKYEQAAIEDAEENYEIDPYDPRLGEW